MCTRDSTPYLLSQGHCYRHSSPLSCINFPLSFPVPYKYSLIIKTDSFNPPSLPVYPSPIPLLFTAKFFKKVVSTCCLQFFFSHLFPFQPHHPLKPSLQAKCSKCRSRFSVFIVLDQSAASEEVTPFSHSYLPHMVSTALPIFHPPHCFSFLSSSFSSRDFCVGVPRSQS